MKESEFSKLDKVLEQCTWVNTYFNHGERTLKFYPKTGVIIRAEQTPMERVPEFIEIKKESSEEIYKTYLDTIKVSKEKAFVNCSNEGIFGCHHLMRAMYYKLGGEVKRELLSSHPECFI